VDQSRHHFRPSEPLEMHARFAQALSERAYRSDAELAPDKSIQVDTSCDNVAPRFLWREVGAIWQRRSVQRLTFNEREMVAPKFLRAGAEGAHFGDVALTRQSPPQ
jgi:hypothetical protein